MSAVLQGTVAAVDEVALTVDIVVPALTGDQVLAGCPYVAGATPVAGDACLAIFDDAGQAWAVVPGAAPAGAVGPAGPPGITGGKSVIATQEGQPSASFVVMPTPDRVTVTVTDTDTLVFVVFWAQVRATNGASIVSIGVDGARASDPFGTPDNAVIATAGAWGVVCSGPGGLEDWVSAATPLAADQLIGCATVLRNLSAGSHDIEILYANNSGPSPGVEAKERHLYVWTQDLP